MNEFDWWNFVRHLRSWQQFLGKLELPSTVYTTKYEWHLSVSKCITPREFSMCKSVGESWCFINIICVLVVCWCWLEARHSGQALTSVTSLHSWTGEQKVHELRIMRNHSPSVGKKLELDPFKFNLLLTKSKHNNEN